MKKVSVLIPTYNRASFIEEALQSILFQGYKEDLEIVIFDDGSYDLTPTIIKKYQTGSFPYKIKYLREFENHGVGYARNRLLEQVDGDYFVWQDSDDASAACRVQNLVKAIESQNVDALFSDMYFYKHPNQSRKYLSKIDVTKYINRDGLSNNMHFATGIFKSSLKDFKFDETARRKEDVIWLTDLIEANVKFGYLPEPLYFCRRHSGRLTPERP